MFINVSGMQHPYIDFQMVTIYRQVFSNSVNDSGSVYIWNTFSTPKRVYMEYNTHMIK